MTLATPPSSPIEVNDERPGRGEGEVCYILIFLPNTIFFRPLFPFYLSFTLVQKIHIYCTRTNAPPITFIDHRPQKYHYYPRIPTTLTHISTRHAPNSTYPTYPSRISRIPSIFTRREDSRTPNPPKQIPRLPNQVPLSRKREPQPNNPTQAPRRIYPTHPRRTGLYQNGKHENLWSVGGEGEGNEHSEGATRFFFSGTRICQVCSCLFIIFSIFSRDPNPGTQTRTRS